MKGLAIENVQLWNIHSVWFTKVVSQASPLTFYSIHHLQYWHVEETCADSLMLTLFPHAMLILKVMGLIL